MVWFRLLFFALIATLCAVTWGGYVPRRVCEPPTSYFAPPYHNTRPVPSYTPPKPEKSAECTLGEVVNKLTNALIYTTIHNCGRNSTGGGMGGTGGTGGTGGGTGGTGGGTGGGGTGGTGGTGGSGTGNTLASLLGIDVTLLGQDLLNINVLPLLGGGNSTGSLTLGSLLGLDLSLLGQTLLTAGVLPGLLGTGGGSSAGGSGGLLPGVLGGGTGGTGGSGGSTSGSGVSNALESLLGLNVSLLGRDAVVADVLPNSIVGGGSSG